MYGNKALSTKVLTIERFQLSDFNFLFLCKGVKLFLYEDDYEIFTTS